MTKNRCSWANTNPVMKQYHDMEWGQPNYNDHYLFEMLILEGKQAGLSWQIILNRREALKEALDNFDYHIIANYTDEKLEQLRYDDRLIKNRLKINALRENAKQFIAIQNEFGSFSNYIWQFTNNEVIHHHIQNEKDIPTKNELSDLISKDLKKRGFKFVGSTIIYSYLQAIGIINDHTIHCFKYNAI